MSRDQWVQIVLKFPLRMAQEFHRTAARHGLTKAAFVAYLFDSHRNRKVVAMEDIQKDVLRYLWKWGPRNGHQGPAPVNVVAGQMRYVQEAVTAAAMELEAEGLLARAPLVPGAGFRNDMAVSPTERLFLTSEGRLAASAL